MSVSRKLLVLLTALCGVYSRGSDATGAFVFNVQQVGQNVVVTGSGTIDTVALSRFSGESRVSAISPANGVLDVGPTTSTPSQQLVGFTAGPVDFGSGGLTYASSGYGDVVGVDFSDRVDVPGRYISGAPLTDSATFDSQTFSSLGLTQGTYVYTWGTGATADSLTINIGVVPEPASAALIAAPVAIAMLRRRRRWLVR